MEKKIILLLLFYSSFFFSQKIQIVENVTSKPIANARIITEGKIYYTNDEGYGLLGEHSKNLEISAFGYETTKENEFKSIIKLNPVYKDIDEIKIVSIDFQKILKNVSDHYSEIYYDRPIIYDVTVKQKQFENDSLKMLMVADGKFWSKDGQYYAKDAFKNNFNNFVQLENSHLRFLKTEPSENKVQVKKSTVSHDNIGDMFLSYELWRTLSLSKKKHAKISGRLLYENVDEQEISYSIKSDSTYIYTGKILYNKKDKAITHFEIEFNQSNSEPIKYKDINGKDFYRQLGDGIIMFDYYKKDGKYFPSKISFNTDGFKTITDTESFEYSSARDIIFKSFQKTDENGLENPVKINEAYWKDLKISANKGEILLTKEEQEFTDEKIKK